MFFTKTTKYERYELLNTRMTDIKKSRDINYKIETDGWLPNQTIEIIIEGSAVNYNLFNLILFGFEQHIKETQILNSEWGTISFNESTPAISIRIIWNENFCLDWEPTYEHPVKWCSNKPFSI